MVVAWDRAVSQRLRGSVESLDLSLGLGVVRVVVLLPDVQRGEHVLELVACSGVAGGLDTTVIGQRGRWRAVGIDAAEERVDDVAAGDGSVGGAGEQVAGMVIEPVQDLDVSAVREAPVGEVGLPGFVGLGRFEPYV